MTRRYEATYTFGDEPMTLIFPEGTFEALPYEIRLLGPWFGASFIDISGLKSAQRLELMLQGYTIVREAPKMLQAA